MSYSIKALGPLQDYLKDLQEVTLTPEGEPVSRILQDLGIPSELVAAVVANDELVQKSYIPKAGDEIKLLMVLGGG